ncbi:DUF5682 family protein [Streptomyces chattanoogensis]|uniref:ChaN family lipoprotein n=1 Tax=Streptomyces chattanoogensis TaxID=66876 RepID=A0A0N0GXM7_9ACTN|nr:DUF5682 family protein [Streptomyces chattanoogensis]KPC61092.1 hypothetical protein ADL29_26645 [Streptomyces chattanoogensis]
MTVRFVGVRHHSPACARLVASTIESLRPAFVLVEGPADVNDRIDELLLGHDLPIAVFSSYRDGERYQNSWAPLCAYSPEWVALSAGRACGAEVRFIDLPAWHPAFAGRSNRYADADRWGAEAVDRLCKTFGIDNEDVLWDHLFEVESEAEPEPEPEPESESGAESVEGGEKRPVGTRPEETGQAEKGPLELGLEEHGLAERLSAYFSLIRGEERAGEDDLAREAYMARWVRAAVAEAGDRPVVVVTGGFHQPALRALSAQETAGESGWPEVPRPPEEAVAASYLVPYSFRRLDAFTGYESGMPSPEYYQRLWDGGARAAADGLAAEAVTQLRRRGQVVSTADLIAARAMTEGLAQLRGPRIPSRTDVLDGLAGALVSDDLGQRLPWAARGPLAPGAHPVVAELVAAFSGDRVGRLHPDTPMPPLVHDATAQLERVGLDPAGVSAPVLDLADDRGLRRSRVLHRLRVLGIPGCVRQSGPATGADAVLKERWQLSLSDRRLPRLIEAGAYGATLRDAAAALLRERIADAGNDAGLLAGVLFDVALCGLAELSEGAIDAIDAGVAAAVDLGELGRALATVLGLWRHDRLLGVARSPLLGAVISAAVTRILWLAEGVHGGPAPADRARLYALAAVRDALVHAGEQLALDRAPALATARRISADTTAPPDLRGAAFGLCWSLAGERPTGASENESGSKNENRSESENASDGQDGKGAGPAPDPAEAIAGTAGPDVLGDWLAGLFALARAEVLGDGRERDSESVLGVLDTVVSAMTGDEFLVALPALRQAFAYFPPREREAIARGLLDRRGLRGSARGLTRTAADPVLAAEAMALEDRVTRLLAREGLGPVGNYPAVINSTRTKGTS